MRQSKDEISVWPDRLHRKGAAQCVSALVQRQHTAQLAGRSVLDRLDIVEDGHFGDRELPLPEIHPHAVPRREYTNRSGRADFALHRIEDNPIRGKRGEPSLSGLVNAYPTADNRLLILPD